MNRPKLQTLVLAAVAVSGIAAVLWATSLWGVGVTPDSVRYLDGARNLLKGRGLVALDRQCGWAPLTQFPPLFSSLLAGLGLIGIEPMDGARWLNALAFGANIFLVGILIQKRTRDSLFSLLGSLFILTSVDLLTIHSMAFSEPVFIFFMLGGLYFLDAFLENAKRVDLALSALMAALAFLNRYLGAAWGVTGALAILLMSRKNFHSRVFDASLFAVIASLPMAAWMAGNTYQSGVTSQDRGIALHPIAFNHVLPAIVAFTEWFSPVQVASRTAVIFTTLFGTTLLASFFILLRKGKMTWRQWVEACLPPSSRILVLFILAYLGLLILSISFFDADAAITNRYLSPVYVSLVIIILCVLHRARQNSPIAQYQPLILVLILIFLGTYVYRSARLVYDLHQNGQWFSAKEWRGSQVIRELEKLSSSTRIYSNLEEVIYFLTGAAACRLPPKVNHHTMMSNANYSSAMSQMAEDIANHKAVLVYFNRVSWRWFLPSEEEMRGSIPLDVIFTSPEGSVYQGKPFY